MQRIIRAFLVLLAYGVASPALAQESAKFPLELNRLEQDGQICRVYLLVKNPDETAIKDFKLDLVFFDTDNIIRNRLYVELGPLPAAKTAVRLFDIPDSDCAALGSILVNDVVTCADSTGAKLECLKRLELVSRTDAELRY